jgi:hypothetical protein
MKIPEDDKMPWTIWIVMAVVYVIMIIAVWIMEE